MKKYIFQRVIKSIIAIFLVVAVVVAMVYTLIDTKRIFENDTTFNKLKGNERVVYRFQTLENLGYLDYATMGEMCNVESKNNTGDCIKKDSESQKKVLKVYEDKGYTIQKLTGGGNLNGQYIATRNYTVFELIGRYFKNLIIVDRPGKIQDPNNPELDQNRGYYFGTDHNGVPALMCTGCEYKYQIYFNGQFPFIHSNILSLNFGNSYPSRPGSKTVDVISEGQGVLDNKDIVYPTGQKGKGAEDLHSLRYKKNPDHLDELKYLDNYADATLNKKDRSMIGNSYLFGVTSLILAYVIAIPAGVAMARNKGKFIDKLGILYINILIAIPSLAFIFIMKYFGSFFDLPDKFPQLGAGNIKSYIMPILILTILSTSGIMTWIRRYMIDQSSADYVKFAKAKGLSKKEISKNHILKNAIIPIVNGIPASIVLSISGSIITESVFAIPGMGKMLPDAISGANNNMVITLTFILTALSIFSLFAGDLLLTVVDPRISLNAKKGDI
ncbi:ABC transporter permease [Helcococcus kunzii]|uniref:ABC transmembrane type-1 domain-containing protein n=1 Tax=Helcococcus kunzii ATCC 51366 TaxID=883114 RepID=H3NLQ0_9FIRM|nr:ABC transporter permease [Helcococcus kunzii]EHR35753.1 hypothetical protein HMPREF9709_00261 [Helcococcus kunzii ATCC 51366]MCT1796282.1 ABC transporter permease [Helcococcus kunzii]MCT1989140.1 ABC transporter permease [Helcococcus kunzii]QUY64190.1 ABC transporter permease [Helcococcus kunzii]QZO76646.1 ABC transporter permease [Helcococcus kunzii]